MIKAKLAEIIYIISNINVEYNINNISNTMQLLIISNTIYAYIERVVFLMCLLANSIKDIIINVRLRQTKRKYENHFRMISTSLNILKNTLSDGSYNNKNEEYNASYIINESYHIYNKGNVLTTTRNRKHTCINSNRYSVYGHNTWSVNRVSWLVIVIIYVMICNLVVVKADPLCDIVAATNIQSFRSLWSCTTAGVASTPPCTPPVWTGITCTGGTVTMINFVSVGITGNMCAMR